MKKFFDTIRRGLIKILGGYTEQPNKYVWDAFQNIEHVDVNPVKVTALLTIPHVLSKDYTKEYLTDAFMHAIGEQIRNHEDLYKVHESYYPITDEDIYKIEVNLLPINK